MSVRLKVPRSSRNSADRNQAASRNADPNPARRSVVLSRVARSSNAVPGVRKVVSNSAPASSLSSAGPKGAPASNHFSADPKVVPGSSVAQEAPAVPAAINKAVAAHNRAAADSSKRLRHRKARLRWAPMPR